MSRRAVLVFYVHHLRQTIVYQDEIKRNLLFLLLLLQILMLILYSTINIIFKSKYILERRVGELILCVLRRSCRPLRREVPVGWLGRSPCRRRSSTCWGERDTCFIAKCSTQQSRSACSIIDFFSSNINTSFKFLQI